MKEVGTTNRTRIEDYKAAVSEKTKAFLKVHTSNYRIVGFTESVSAEELYELSTGLIECTQELPPENFENHTERSGIPVIEDLGSGVLIKLDEYGLSKDCLLYTSDAADEEDSVYLGGRRIIKKKKKKKKITAIIERQ